MTFNLEVVKRHPVLAGAVVFGGAVILYLLIKHGSASASQPNASTSDAQLQSIAGAEAVASAQYGAQLQIAQIQGQVASEQTQASLAAIQTQAQAAENIVSTQTAGAVQQTQITADAGTQAAKINADAQTEIAHTVVNGQIAETQSALDAYNTAQQHQFDLASQVITSAGADKGRSSTGWAQIISALGGQGPAAIAANQPSQVASSNATGNIISSITKGIFSLF